MVLGRAVCFFFFFNRKVFVIHLYTASSQNFMKPMDEFFFFLCRRVFTERTTEEKAGQSFEEKAGQSFAVF